MVHVRLWAARRGFDRPHGVVHIACGQVPRRANREWPSSRDEHTADVHFPNHELYWCSRNQCFGPNNPRRFPREQ